MTMLALGTGFFGSILGMLFLSSASFLAGVIFKTAFLRLVTGGRYEGK